MLIQAWCETSINIEKVINHIGGFNVSILIDSGSLILTFFNLNIKKIAAKIIIIKPILDMFD